MKKLAASLLAFLLCLNMSTAFAAEQDPPAEAPSGEGSLSVLNLVDNRPAEGVRFDLYRVADQVDGEFEWLERFAGYKLELDPDAESFATLPTNLSVYISRDGLESDATGTTDADGKTAFDGLVSGLYLLTGSSYRRGSYRYDVVPALVVLPYIEVDGHDLIWNGNLEVKHTSRYVSSGGGGYTPPKKETVSRHVLKTWDDIDNESERPDHVEVQLLKDSEVFSTVILNEANNWRYTWTELDADADWYVVEDGVPDDYEVSIEQNGITFVVTNVFTEELKEEPNPPKEEEPDVEIDETEPPKEEIDPDVTPEPTPSPENPEKLPQTGQPWLPVFAAAGCGIACIFIGLVSRRKAGERDA